MRTILQRVSRASVSVEGREVGSIGPGLVLLTAIEKGDETDQVEKTVSKLAGLRVFDDEDGRMNLPPEEVGAQFLVVSQFTLAASLDRGRRPSFDRAAPAEKADHLVSELAARLALRGFEVETGVFGARMSVELVNDGPVTFVLDV